MHLLLLFLVTLAGEPAPQLKQFRATQPHMGVLFEIAAYAPDEATAKRGFDAAFARVADGESGFLVPPSDPAALAEKIEILLRDPALCARFGAAGRRRIDELFTLNGMVENIVRVYEDCLTRR